MNPQVVTELIMELSVLKFFPSEAPARMALVRMAGEMAASEDQIRWLVKRCLVLYNEWPGPRELRALFCARFKPRDGIEVSSCVFPEGIPPEKRIEQPMLALPPGHSASVDPGLERGIMLLARMKDMDRPIKVKVAPQVTVDLHQQRRITQADIDKELERVKEARANAELHG